MKQKLGLICTLIHEPEFAILDEPTTGVDPVSRRDFWSILAELIHTKGRPRLSQLPTWTKPHDSIICRFSSREGPQPRELPHKCGSRFRNVFTFKAFLMEARRSAKEQVQAG